MTTEYTEWQCPFSGVHSVMRVKSEQAGEGARPPPFTTSTITFSVVVYTLAERAVTLLLFLLYHDLYSVFRTEDKGVVLVFNGF